MQAGPVRPPAPPRPQAQAAYAQLRRGGPRGRRRGAATALLLWSLAGPGGLTGPAALGATAPLSDLQAVEQALATAILDARREAGLDAGWLGRPPAWNGTLALAAQRYAARLSDRAVLVHEDPDDPTGQTPQDRVARLGAREVAVGEILAKITVLPVPDGTVLYRAGEGFSTQPGAPALVPRRAGELAEAVVRGWLNSPGHKAILLSGRAVEYGAGAAWYVAPSGLAYVVAAALFQYDAPLR